MSKNPEIVVVDEEDVVEDESKKTLFQKRKIMVDTVLQDKRKSTHEKQTLTKMGGSDEKKKKTPKKWIAGFIFFGYGLQDLFVLIGCTIVTVYVFLLYSYLHDRQITSIGSDDGDCGLDKKLTIIGWTSLILGFTCVVGIGYDLLLFILVFLFKEKYTFAFSAMNILRALYELLQIGCSIMFFIFYFILSFAYFDVEANNTCGLPYGSYFFKDFIVVTLIVVIITGVAVCLIPCFLVLAYMPTMFFLGFFSSKTEEHKYQPLIN